MTKGSDEVSRIVAQGNAAFQRKDYHSAMLYYSGAIDIDPGCANPGSIEAC